MADISEKKITKRTAIASAQIHMGREAFAAFRKGHSPKGDILETAKISGIIAAKFTPSLIPFCHPLELNKVHLSFEVDGEGCLVKIFSEVVCLGRTGVEMEALTAVSIAALTIYDMMKWADKGMVISHVRLLKKTGGKSGTYEKK